MDDEVAPKGNEKGMGDSRGIPMTDSGRPTPTAWWCETHERIKPDCEEYPISTDPCRHTPLFPPSVVAGELYEMASWINKTFGDKPDGTHNDELDETVLELARRGKAWESK